MPATAQRNEAALACPVHVCSPIRMNMSRYRW
jgi:hypothetical protein